MLRFALRRFYLAIVGLMLLSLPLFAVMRAPPHSRDLCGPTVFCDGYRPIVRPEHRPWPRLIWQTGLPPNDWWPIAVALLAAEGTATLVLSQRRARPN